MNPHEITGHFHAYPALLLGMQIVLIMALLMSAYLMIYELWKWPLHKAAQLLSTLIILMSVAFVGWAVLALAPLTAVKLALILSLLVGILCCLVGLTNVERWHQSLAKIQQECDLAANLVFLQGEMTRSQLEALNERLKHAVEPEEREITETMLKSISPFVMLYLHKEKNMIKWSLAAANMGRDLFNYFWK